MSKHSNGRNLEEIDEQWWGEHRYGEMIDAPGAPDAVRIILIILPLKRET